MVMKKEELVFDNGLHKGSVVKYGKELFIKLFAVKDDMYYMWTDTIGILDRKETIKLGNFINENFGINKKLKKDIKTIANTLRNNAHDIDDDTTSLMQGLADELESLV